ncbi:MAG: nicotinate-nucleotide diphosphorylase (carboxylating), partial [Candidatus Omnitrophica bacterium]|nr:nicotinate-nucleotide diphosphorylase (carboxylating) [Candidatus Omnitrophota bacterium]
MSLNKRIQLVVKNALGEDIKGGDITTSLSIPAKLKGEAWIVAQEKGILCGIATVKSVFRQLDKGIKFKVLKRDGSIFKKGDKIALIRGKMRTILTGERVALNFLSLLSGVSTLT